MSPKLFENLNLAFHEYKVKTSDGWILKLYRIASRTVSSLDPLTGLENKRKAVVLWHGLSTNHEIFISSQRHDSLATWLFDRDYDVWLANSRGTLLSHLILMCGSIGNAFTSHSTLSSSQEEYWDFSLEKYAIDVDAVVDFILEKTRRKSLSYIGFSQGSSICIAALSLYHELNVKIDHLIGLAPAMKPARWQGFLNNFIDMISPTGLFSILGKKSFFPIASLMSDYCPLIVTKTIIHAVITSTLGWKLDKYGSLERQMKLYRHIFGLTSVKSFIHWFQLIQQKRFQHFDYRFKSSFCTRPNQSIPPLHFPTLQITTKVSLYCGGKDNLSDNEYMERNLPPHTKIVHLEEYEHLDLIWAHDAHKEWWNDIMNDLGREDCSEGKGRKDSGSLLPSHSRVASLFFLAPSRE